MAARDPKLTLDDLYSTNHLFRNWEPGRPRSLEIDDYLKNRWGYHGSARVRFLGTISFLNSVRRPDAREGRFD
jgi:hypothetical protein